MNASSSGAARPCAATPALPPLFHGTDQPPFEQFVRSHRGSLGPGFYLTSDAHAAYNYGGENPDANIAQVAANLRNPFRFRAVEPEVVDSWGEGLAIALFGQPAAQPLLEAAADGDGLFGDEIEVELRRRGHDGVICEFDDGWLEVNILDRESFRVVAWHRGADWRSLAAAAEAARNAQSAVDAEAPIDHQPSDQSNRSNRSSRSNRFFATP